MIAQLGLGWKVEESTERLASFAGLPLLTELAHRSKLVRDLDELPGLWERLGRYRTSDYVLSLALTLIAGGEGLEDTRLLREDGGLQGWLWKDLPAPNSQGDFLRRFGHMALSRLGRVNARQVRRLLARGGHKRLTLDIDSSLIEADKKEMRQPNARRRYSSGENPSPDLRRS